MEQYDYNDTQQNADQLLITDEIKTFLKQTARWAKFLSIVGFIIIGIMAIVAILMMFFIGDVLKGIPETQALGFVGGVGIGITYLILGAIYFFPVLYLYRFANKMSLALEYNNQEELHHSFSSLKSHYTLVGILITVFFILYAVILFLTILFGGLAFLNN